MPKAIFYCAYNLKKDASAAEFLAASQKLNDDYISKQPGYISWQQVRDGDLWADLLTFETMEDVKNFEANSENPNELALEFYSYINMPTCKINYFTIESEYSC